MKLSLSLLLLCLLLTAACSPAPSAPQTSSDGTNASEAQPKSGGQLRIRITSDIDNFDITTADKAVAGRIVPLATDTLLSLKSGPDVGFVDVILAPGLAEQWEVSADAKTFTFHLRKGVKFANLPPVNGRELTSADVKFSYEYLTRTGGLKDQKLPKAQFDWMFEGMEAIETPDPSTLVVRFKDSFAPFLNYAASPNNPILAREIFEQDGNYKDRLIGTGPFQFDRSSSQSGSKWVFKKNTNYFEPGKPYLDEIVQLVLPENATAYAAFQTRQLDQIVAFSAASSQTVAQQNPSAVQFEGLNPAPTNIYINSRVAPMNDLRVRKALAYAINRDDFIKTFGGGKGEWALAGALPDTFKQEEVRQILKYDPAESRRLLAEAGYPNGLDVEWISFASDPEETKSELQLLQAQARQAGINIQIKPLDRQDAIDRRRKGDFTLSGVGKALESDAESYLYQVFYPGAGNNYGGVNDPKLTDLIAAQRREADPAKRKEIIRQAVRYINQDQVWGIANYYRVEYYYWQPYLKGYYPNRWIGSQPLYADPTGIWLDK